MIYIYAYQNNVNGKIYIGQTVNIKKRDTDHRNANLWPLEKAIKKYGRECFDYWTISIASTQEEADQEEIYWIGEMRKQLGLTYVYNICDGGQRRSISEEAKKRLSALAKAAGRRPPSNTGRFIDPEWRANLSAANKGKTNWKKGKKLTWVDGKRVWVNRIGDPVSE